MCFSWDWCTASDTDPEESQIYSLRRTDPESGDLLGSWDRWEVEESALVVLTSDHGEEFLEHGFVDHAWTLYEESVRVPLIFWAPRELEPDRVEAPVSTVDILPTLLRLMEIPHEGPFDGNCDSFRV